MTHFWSLHWCRVRLHLTHFNSINETSLKMCWTIISILFWVAFKSLCSCPTEVQRANYKHDSHDSQITVQTNTTPEKCSENLHECETVEMWSPSTATELKERFSQWMIPIRSQWLIQTNKTCPQITMSFLICIFTHIISEHSWWGETGRCRAVVKSASVKSNTSPKTSLHFSWSASFTHCSNQQEVF